MESAFDIHVASISGLPLRYYVTLATYFDFLNPADLSQK